MALKLVQPGTQPLGQFDGVDTEIAALKGGEIMTFTSVAVTSSDKAAKDVFDGYVIPSNTQKRTYATRNVATTKRPLMLSDDGISGYGTLFGTIVGGTAGQVVSGGTTLGPNTTAGSGKVTLWDKQGVYAVSTDATDTGNDGLVPGNTTLDVGTSLTWTPSSATGGLLTPVGSTNAGGNTVVVGRFIEWETNGSLVTTPNRLVGTLNAPDGSLATSSSVSVSYALFYFSPPVS